MKETIRHILKEETILKKKLKDMVNQLGWEKASFAVGGPKKLAEILFNGNPYEFLDDFDLTIKNDTENDNIYFIDNNSKKMIYIDSKIKMIFFDYDKIWSFLEKGFKDYILNEKQILYQWLKNKYGITGFSLMYAHWLNYR